MSLSIIIPVYNNFENLSRCLRSLEKQTVFNHELAPSSCLEPIVAPCRAGSQQTEVIVVDDGSDIPFCHPDPERVERAEGEGFLNQGISQRHCLRDSSVAPLPQNDNMLYNVRFFRIEHSGASAARNFGFAKSSGKYILFCDSDVVFLKNNALEKMVRTLEENPDKAYCYSSFKYGWKTFKCGEFDAEKLKENNYISTMSLIRRSALEKVIQTTIGQDKQTTTLKGVRIQTAPSTPLGAGFRQVLDRPKGRLNLNKPFDENLKRFQDWDLWLSLLERGETGIFIPEVLWQAEGGGTMSKWLPKFLYKFPFKFKLALARFPWLKEIIEFEKAKQGVRRKHGL